MKFSSKYIYILPMILFFVFSISCSKKKTDDSKKVNIRKKVPVKIKLKVNNKSLKKTSAGKSLFPKLKLKKAESLIAEKKYVAALDIYNELAKLKSLTSESRSQIFAGRASVYFWLKRYEESIIAWEKVIAIRQSDTYAIVNLALVYRDAGKLDMAVKQYEKVIKLDGDQLMVRMDLISLLTKMKKPNSELISAVTKLDEVRNKMVEKLKLPDDKISLKKRVALLEAFLEVPATQTSSFGDIKLEILSPLLTHKSFFIRRRAGELAVRTADGLKKVSQLLEKEKNPLVKKAWKYALTEKSNK
jgi:tetratricopeptide (TPR) repeat protein